MENINEMVSKCYYYDLLPKEGKDTMSTRVDKFLKSTTGEENILKFIMNRAEKKGKSIISITLRDSYLWSSKPGDIDIYVVVNEDQHHEKEFQDLNILIPIDEKGLEIKSDIWFAGKNNINDLQKTWLYRRGVTLTGEDPFSELPKFEDDLYIKFAFQKLFSEASEFLKSGNYRKMLHRLVSASYFGYLLHTDPKVKEAHKDLAKKLLFEIYSNTEYGKILKNEYINDFNSLLSWNNSIEDSVKISIDFINFLLSFDKMKPEETNQMFQICKNFFHLFSMPKVDNLINNLSVKPL